MTGDSRFRAPRTLARALAEVARRAGGVHAREAELRAALPAAMGAWLHSRLEDIRLPGAACVLVMRDEAGAREALALLPEIQTEVRRRMGAEAPARVTVERSRRPLPRPDAPVAPAVRERPLVTEALSEVADPQLRRRLARWARVSIDPDQGGET